eukprot:1393868-Amorphochlora_amoeboformis.AAC.1
MGVENGIDHCNDLASVASFSMDFWIFVDPSSKPVMIHKFTDKKTSDNEDSYQVYARGPRTSNYVSLEPSSPHLYYPSAQTANLPSPAMTICVLARVPLVVSEKSADE